MLNNNISINLTVMFGILLTPLYVIVELNNVGNCKLFFMYTISVLFVIFCAHMFLWNVLLCMVLYSGHHAGSAYHN